VDGWEQQADGADARCKEPRVSPEEQQEDRRTEREIPDERNDLKAPVAEDRVDGRAHRGDAPAPAIELRAVLDPRWVEDVRRVRVVLDHRHRARLVAVEDLGDRLVGAAPQELEPLRLVEEAVRVLPLERADEPCPACDGGEGDEGDGIAERGPPSARPHRRTIVPGRADSCSRLRA